MRVEQQKGPECMLATIAALANRPLAEAREIACKAAQVKNWSNVFRKPQGDRQYYFWRGVNAVCKAFDPTGDLRDVVSSFAGAEVPTLPDKGRGTVLLSNLRGKGHIAPFEDGKVYDPNYPDEPCSLATFVGRYPHMRYFVKRITVSRTSCAPSRVVWEETTESPDLGY